MEQLIRESREEYLMIGQKINRYNTNSNIFNNYNQRSYTTKISSSPTKNNQAHFHKNSDQIHFSGVRIPSATVNLNWFESFCSKLAKIGQTRTEALKASTGKGLAAPVAISLYPSKTDKASRAYSAALQPFEGAVRFGVFLLTGLFMGRAAKGLATKGILGKFFTEGSKEVAKGRVDVFKDIVTVGGTIACVPATSSLVDKTHPVVVPKVMKSFNSIKNIFKVK